MILFYKTVSRFDAKRCAGSRQLAGGDHTIEEDVGRDPYDEVVEFASGGAGVIGLITNKIDITRSIVCVFVDVGRRGVRQRCALG